QANELQGFVKGRAFPDHGPANRVLRCSADGQDWRFTGFSPCMFGPAHTLEEHLMLTLPKHNRYEYSAIGDRKDYSWPGGKRLAFCVITNIEVYAYRKGTGWDPAKKGEPQQQRNYAWRDYGNPVGTCRLTDLY